MTLVVAVTFAVVGIAAPSSAHHNTITGSVACRDGGGWTVTWRVINSERINEAITASNRPSAVPVGTTFGPSQTKYFTETIDTKPTSTVTLTLSSRWTNGVSATNSGSIPVASFADACNVKIVQPPTVPVVDACGPGNAQYGPVPSGPWTVRTNADGSLTVTALPGHSFGNGQTSVTFPVPTDSNQPCVVPPPVVPPVVVPPAVVPPAVVPPVEVLPAQVQVVRANVRHIDKCGRTSDLYKVAERSGVVYTVRGKVIRQGAWLRARTRTVTVRAQAADATFALQGRQVWKMTFTSKRCAQAPEVAPATGS